MIDHTRHIGIFNANEQRICLIGAGGIGAITAVTLAKMGVQTLTIYDSDTVDEVNIATQFHRESDIGLSKAVAISSIIDDFSDVVALYYPERVTAETKNFPQSADIYISAVDSIKSRQGIWEAVKKLNRNKYAWYIDARMGAEVYEHFAVKVSRSNWYNALITDDRDDHYEEIPCTSKATIYTAAMAAGHVGAAVRRIITGDQVPGLLRHDILNNKLFFQEMEM
jgi:hypothetical protein